MSVLYHGGAPGLHPGDIIEPGHSRDLYDDCPICQDRKQHGPDAFEGTKHPNQVYCTKYREYAAWHASLYGKGSVYQVKPLDVLADSEEDFEGCYRCNRLQVVRLVECSVEFDWKRRRKAIRLCQRLTGDTGPGSLPKAGAPAYLIEAWQRATIRQAQTMMNR